jgi:predicted Zn-dependent protease with MMP-like domain
VGPESVSAEEFETMVVDALDSLPGFVAPMMREMGEALRDLGRYQSHSLG